MRPIRAIVNLSALVSNYKVACSIAPKGGRTLAVIKADAYGHGAVPCAQVLEKHAPMLAVCSIDEALEIRAGGVNAPILLLEGLFKQEEVELAAMNNFVPVVHSEYQIDHMKMAAASSIPVPPSVWLKIDSGMHRLGCSLDKVATCMEQLKLLNIKVDTLMTHFSCADEVEHPATAGQIERFNEVTTGHHVPLSVRNSAAILRNVNGWETAHGNWDRPGIMLYGSSSLDAAITTEEKLQPVMTFEADVIAVRDVPVGDSVGYGELFTAKRPTRVATVACGYADGYPRELSDGAPVAVDGVPATLIGRVSMDMVTVDITDIPSANVGSTVELWGNSVSSRKLADSINTITYELFTQVTKRVPRIYKD